MIIGIYPTKVAFYAIFYASVNPQNHTVWKKQEVERMILTMKENKRLHVIQEVLVTTQVFEVNTVTH